MKPLLFLVRLICLFHFPSRSWAQIKSIMKTEVFRPSKESFQISLWILFATRQWNKQIPIWNEKPFDCQITFHFDSIWLFSVISCSIGQTLTAPPCHHLAYLSSTNFHFDWRKWMCFFFIVFRKSPTHWHIYVRKLSPTFSPLSCSQFAALPFSFSFLFCHFVFFLLQNIFGGNFKCFFHVGTTAVPLRVISNCPSVYSLFILVSYKNLILFPLKSTHRDNVKRKLENEFSVTFSNCNLTRVDIRHCIPLQNKSNDGTRIEGKQVWPELERGGNEWMMITKSTWPTLKIWYGYTWPTNNVSWDNSNR